MTIYKTARNARGWREFKTKRKFNNLDEND